MTADKLSQQPFSYRHTGSRVTILYFDKSVKTLAGTEAEKFLEKASHLSDGNTAKQLQLLMAKASGNFKRGNERRVTSKTRR